MAKLNRNFTGGKMNKTFDERIVPNGEYIDAQNIRMGSTENSEIGVIENTKGNLALTKLSYDGRELSTDAVCIGAIGDSSKENIYWFVHDPFFPSATGKLDLIVSFNVFTNILTYHVISVAEGTSTTQTTLNFNPQYLITGVNIIEDLLFFTDNYNPPRFINVKRNYPDPLAGVDGFSAESILVIKKPPIESPSIALLKTTGQENYIETRFLCFAYRYRYADGEYSAISQWTEPAFAPQSFSFSIQSFLNQGMENFYNYVNITYNSGGPLVVGIDLLFKESNSNIIKIIERLDKQDLGIPDNTNVTYGFNNSKIYTILPESELFRLYDNVPLLAKSQTIMGNRLMYGNYIEGYDLVDSKGDLVKFDYYTQLSSIPIGETNLSTSIVPVFYFIDSGQLHVSFAGLNVDLTGVNLVSGSLLSIDIILDHDSFTGTSIPAATTGPLTINFSFYLPQDYSSVYQMATSVQFQDAVGTYSNIQPVGSSCSGITFTDSVNCVIPMFLGSLNKFRYGIYNIASDQPIAILTYTSSNVITFKLVASGYKDPSNPSLYAFEYYRIINASATFTELANARSLHSNRDYEIGIVYMDDFNRSSTALVSKNNTEHVQCSDSVNKNSIIAYIPSTQIAPYWASRYKFVIKPSAYQYETIYSNMFYIDNASNKAYFLLEGENARKVEQGDRLIVKADSNGPTNNCIYATVLEKESKQSFTQPNGNLVPSGVYMSFALGSFSMVDDPLSYINLGWVQTTQALPSYYPLTKYTVNIADPSNPGMYIDYDIPLGSKIKLYFKFERIGGESSCSKRIYILDKEMSSSSNYTDFMQWWLGDNVDAILNDGTQDIANNTCAIGNIFDPTLAPTDTSIPQSPCTNYYRFYRDTGNNQLILLVKGTNSCFNSYFHNRMSSIYVHIQVFRSDSNFIFETEPTESSPDIFFENNLSFPIVNGAHMGNLQDQDFVTGLPAIVNTGFANCYSFGNGAESYKIRDSIIGKPFNLGERVTSVSAQDYKQAHRFADITYSGIYNPESNLNKLNEFNLGLLNYKYLEVSFGPIQKMDGRETDVLVLQEDKISYVLAGKNLLSDSAAGGAISSVPEVLGTQIARTEKYGISFNPESYVQWGYDRFFTDVKRGAVIQLMGNSYSNEQINVVSDMNMRTWFRDRFNESFNYQKIGGFDPYMNEYVLSLSDKPLPLRVECLDCGISQTLKLSGSSFIKGPYTYCVNLGSAVGQTTVSWSIVSESEGSTYSVSVIYEGLIYNVANPGDEYITFNKDSISDTVCNIEIDYDGDITLDIIVECPIPIPINVIEVVVTNNYDSGDLLYVEYKYVSGLYTSPLQSNLVTFASGISNPLVSRYNLISGFEGQGSFPIGGSTTTLRSNKYGVANKDFNPATDKFKYYRSNTLYNNTPSEISTLLGLASTATPILGGGTLYYAEFTTPPTINGQNLYLIWDLRAVTETTLCYTDGVDIENPVNDVCCNCGACCDQLIIDNIGLSPAIVYFPNGYCGNNFGNFVYIDAFGTAEICVNNKNNYAIIQGDVDIIQPLPDCECNLKCPYSCERWVYYNNTEIDQTISYISCSTGEQIDTVVNSNNFELFCTLIYSTPPSVLSGEIGGTFEKILGCTDLCCESDACATFRLNVYSGTVQAQYVDCTSLEVITTNYSIGTWNICVRKPYLPQFTPFVPGTSFTYEMILDCGCDTGGGVITPGG